MVSEDPCSPLKCHWCLCFDVRVSETSRQSIVLSPVPLVWAARGTRGQGQLSEPVCHTDISHEAREEMMDEQAAILNKHPSVLC